MKYIFCSFMFDDVEENVKNSKSPNSVSGHKFQMNMLNGLADNDCDISVVNVPRIRRYPDYKKILFKRKAFKTKYNLEAVSVGFVNIQLINYITQIVAVYGELKKIIARYRDEKIVLMVYNTYPAPIIAMRRIKKKYDNVIICDVIGDIYGKYGLTPEKTLHGKLLDLVHKKMDQMSSECDVFALATENMADALRVTDKPHIVLEGMYDVKNEVLPLKSEDGKKRVFYAGALCEEYGIGHMLRAFALIKDTNYEFLIAGSGTAVKQVEKASRKDPRIRFLGFITPKEVETIQSSATVLVNPRTSEHEYVKYSFASKNLECLASGIPYVAHNLPCNPKEYGEYVFYPKDESDKALAETIQSVCEMDTEERIRRGADAREFIKQNKNPKAQMSRLDGLLRSM